MRYVSNVAGSGITRGRSAGRADFLQESAANLQYDQGVMTRLNYVSVLNALRASWSDRTSTKWTREKPASGQCSVTALVVQDLCGGRLLKTPFDGAWHFYNEVAGEIHDFTSDQFDVPIHYKHLPATREEALRDTSPHQYEQLQRGFAAALAQIPDIGDTGSL
jgi:hypothetical protein